MRTFDAATTNAINSNIQTVANGKSPHVKLIALSGGGYYTGEDGGNSVFSGALSGYTSASGDYVMYRNGNNLYTLHGGMSSLVASYSANSKDFFSCCYYGGTLHTAYLTYAGSTYTLYVDGSQAVTGVSAGGRIIVNSAGTFVFVIRSSNIYAYKKNGTSWSGTRITLGSKINYSDIFAYPNGNGFVLYAMGGNNCTKAKITSALSVESYTQNYSTTYTNFVYTKIPALVIDGVTYSPEKEIEYATASNALYINVDGGGWSAIATNKYVSVGTDFYVSTTSEIMRFVYPSGASDLTSKIVSAKIDETNDSPIQQLNLTLSGGNDTFDAINPGMRMTLFLQFGINDPIQMGVFYVDSVSYTALSATVNVSCRNSVGYLLKGSTYGRSMSLTMSGAALVNQLCTVAGITASVTVQGLTTSLTYTVGGSSFYDDIISVIGADIYGLVEMPDGSIAFGSPLWLSQNYRSNGEYNFTESELFTRQKTKSADAVNTQFGASKGSFVNLTTVPNFGWTLPARYAFPNVPTSVTTQAAFDEWCADQIDRMQYVGKTESYTSPIRPQLQCGDVAKLNGETLGIVTAVSHTIDTNGFRTSFSVDSGGRIMVDGGTISTKTAAKNGYTRKQNMIDLVRVASRGAV